MSRFLLDTHTFLWWIEDSPHLSETARGVIRARDNEIFLSLASVWELAIKVSLEKLVLAVSFEKFLTENLTSNNFHLFPIDLSHIVSVSTLPFHHRDPFDRLLVAQALKNNLPIVSADGMLDLYGIVRFW